MSVSDSSIPLTRVLSKRLKVKPKDAMAMMSSSFIGLLVLAAEKGVKPVGAPFTVYHERGETFDMQFCLPIGDAKIEPTAPVTVESIEVKKVKVMTVKGPYTNLEDAYETLEDKAGQELPKYERYIVGPKDTKKPDDFVTEIMIPKK
jgi:effector-binding domain-containing protein